MPRSRDELQMPARAYSARMRNLHLLDRPAPKTPVVVEGTRIEVPVELKPETLQQSVAVSAAEEPAPAAGHADWCG